MKQYKQLKNMKDVDMIHLHQDEDHPFIRVMVALSLALTFGLFFIILMSIGIWLTTGLLKKLILTADVSCFLVMIYGLYGIYIHIEETPKISWLRFKITWFLNLFN